MTASATSLGHEDLLGGTANAVLLRPGMVRTDEESGPELVCVVEADVGRSHHVRVLDLTSVDITLEHSVGVAESRPVNLELLLDGTSLWKGQGRPAPAEGGLARYRLLGEQVDVAQILLFRRHLGEEFAARTNAWAQQRNSVPSVFRAAVADLRLLLEHAFKIAQDAEADIASLDVLARADRERSFVQVFARSWGTRCLAQYRHLHEISAELASESRTSAIAYATAHLLHLIRPCPILGRANEKPSSRLS